MSIVVNIDSKQHNLANELFTLNIYQIILGSIVNLYP